MLEATPIARRLSPRLRPLLFMALVVAGLAGNRFSFSILNAEFIFGSIFAMLALQIFGWGPGIAAAALISSFTYFHWNHPWAMVTMTAEAAAVGWLIQRPRIHLVTADALAWLLVGIPIGFVGFHLISEMPVMNTLFLLTKQAINGIGNALAARLLFTLALLASEAERIRAHELLADILLFFVLCPFLVLLTLSARADLSETDRRIRETLFEHSLASTEGLETWMEDRRQVVTALADMAGTLPPAQMQERLEQARTYDNNFLRSGRWIPGSAGGSKEPDWGFPSARAWWR